MNIRCLNGNGIKLLAAVLMVVDHIGMFFFPQAAWLRWIGRISLPLFAYMLAEGCRHTKNKTDRLLLLASTALACQIVSFIASGSLRMSILVTFSLSVLIIYSLQAFAEKLSSSARPLSVALAAAGFIGMVFLTFAVTCIREIDGAAFSVEYGFWGCMLAVFPAAADCMMSGRADGETACVVRLAAFAAGLCVLCAAHSNPAQWFSLAALVPLAMYDGRRGKLNLKYFFYVFYPAHLGLFWLISCMI